MFDVVGWFIFLSTYGAGFGILLRFVLEVRLITMFSLFGESLSSKTFLCISRLYMLCILVKSCFYGLFLDVDLPESLDICFLSRSYKAFYSFSFCDMSSSSWSDTFSFSVLRSVFYFTNSSFLAVRSVIKSSLLSKWSPIFYTIVSMISEFWLSLE